MIVRGIVFNISNFFQKITKNTQPRPLGRWSIDPKFTWKNVDAANENHCGGELCTNPLKKRSKNKK